MNKGLREQIAAYMPEKKNMLQKSAQKSAEEDFSSFCERINTGDFKMIKDDQIEVTALNGEMSKNTIWRDAYVKALSAMFSEENIEVIVALYRTAL